MKLKDTKARKIIIEGGYSTSYRLQKLVLNIYNCDRFREVEILSLIKNADNEHIELFYDILENVEIDLESIDNLAEEIIKIHKLK